MKKNLSESSFDAKLNFGEKLFFLNQIFNLLYTKHKQKRLQLFVNNSFTINDSKNLKKDP